MKTYAVIGLGKFGSYVAKGLMDHNINVIAVDKSYEAVKEFKTVCENVVKLDTADPVALKESGISDVDVAVVSIGENIEASILTVMALKDAGVPMVIAKAFNVIHGKILSKIGANRVIYPERDSAKRLVGDFLQNPAFDVIDITNTVKSARFVVSGELNGISIGEINKKLSGIQIVGHKHEKWSLQPDPDTILLSGDTLVAVGLEDDLTEFIKEHYS